MGFNENSSIRLLVPFHRKWNRIPKNLRLYLIFLTLITAFLFSYYVFILSRQNLNETNVLKRNSNFEISNFTEPIQQQEVKNNDVLSQADFKKAANSQNGQQKLIKEAILHSWNGYKKFAWGMDHLKPITKKGQTWFGIGLTILDSLDTLLIAGLDKEFEEALQWIKNDLTFDVNEYVNCFETTIRALAGLLSGYHLSKERILLEKAIDLGDRLIHCYDSPSKTVPFSDVNLKNRTPRSPTWSYDSSLSEVSSVQLELRDLSYESNNKLYENKSFITSKHIHERVLERNDYLLPMYISPITGNLVHSTITLGARADSYYEYLYKQYVQTKIQFLLDDYLKSIEKIQEKLLQITKGELKLTYIGEILTNSQTLNPKMDHLVCFLSGTLALGYYNEYLQKLEISTPNDKFINHLKLSEDLARTCHFMYNLTETGLSPEIAYFGQQKFEQEFYIKPRDTHNLLRPEFVESLFFLYHITHNEKYRNWGMEVFQAFQKYTKISTGGYTTIGDVRHPNNVKPKDFMESFWLAETLKYLYLLFMDDKIIINKLLNNYIFNTEGHLLPKRA